MRTDGLRIAAVVAAGDVRLTVRYRSVILWIFVMPIVFMAFFGLAFRGSSRQAPRARLTVENRDGGFLASALVRELREEPLAIVDADSLRPNQDPVRTLVIPEGFTDGMLSRTRVTLVFRRDEGSNREAGEAAAAAIYRCLIKLAADIIAIEAGEIDLGSEHISVRGDSLVGNLMAAAAARVGGTAFIEARLDSLAAVEPLVTVSASDAGRVKRIPRGFESSVPGNLVMFVLMSMVFSGAGITAERIAGVFRRFAYTPAGRGAVIAGKLGSRMIVAGVQIAFLLSFGAVVFRVSMGSSPAALVLLMLAFAFCTGAFSILIGAALRNPEQVSGIGVVSTLVMAALGGCWWPLEIVPGPFRVVAFFFPTGWAMNGLHKLISFGYGMPEVLLNVAVLVGFGAAFLVVAERRMRWTQ